MLQFRIDYKCIVCDKKRFYIMPIDLKTKTNDIFPSLNKFRVQCKHCGQSYLLSFNTQIINKK